MSGNVHKHAVRNVCPRSPQGRAFSFRRILQHRRLITSGGGGHLETMTGIFPTTFPRTIALEPLLSGHSSPSRLPPLPTPYPTPTMHPTLFALSFPPQLPLSFIFCRLFQHQGCSSPTARTMSAPLSFSSLCSLDWSLEHEQNAEGKHTHAHTQGAGTGSPGNPAAAVAAAPTTQAQLWARASSQNSSTVFLTSGDVLVRTDSARRDTN